MRTDDAMPMHHVLDPEPLPGYPLAASWDQSLAYWRLRRNVSQATIARRTGLSRQLVSRLENGRTQRWAPHWPKLLADALGVSVHTVFPLEQPTTLNPPRGARRREAVTPTPLPVRAQPSSAPPAQLTA